MLSITAPTMTSFPSYALLCLLALALLSPGPNIHLKFWPRSADFWATAVLVNYTIDDTSSLISYSSNKTWRPSTVSCTTCLAPDVQLAYAGTWHDGTHIIPTIDTDDIPQQVATDDDGGKNKGKGKGGDNDGDNGDDGDNNNSKSGEKGGNKGGNSRRDISLVGGSGTLRRQNTEVNNPFFTSNLDSDDPGFVDTPVTVSFTFNGSAIYVFAIVPTFEAPVNTTPTSMNLTYTLDSQPAGTFLHAGSPSAPNTAFDPSVVVFQRAGLSVSPHTLTVSVGPDSVFLLDYITYSQEDDAVNATTSGAPASGPSLTSGVGGSPSPGASQATASSGAGESKSHSVATFAGAVGGSVGLLSLIALSLAISLYRRRLRARRRDRAYRDARHADSLGSFHTDASEDGPPMQGPAPFVPRYFPGTVITAAPPPYSPPAEPSNEPTSALLGPPQSSISWSSRRTGGIASDSDSYAERPPPTPPHNGSGILGGLDAEDGYFPVPPPFSVAIATPIPAILAGLSGGSSPAQATSPPPSTRPTTPASPVIPLLPPPPSSSRSAAPSTAGERSPVTGPSSTLASPAPSMRRVPSQQSTRSIRPHTPDPQHDADGETSPAHRASADFSQAGLIAPVLVPSILSATGSESGTDGQEQVQRSEGEGDTSHR